MAGHDERKDPPSDPLNDPLGYGRAPRRRPLPLRAMLLATASFALIGGVLYLNVRGDPMGGEPHAIALITPVQPAKTPSAPAPARAIEPKSFSGDVTGSIAPAMGDDSAAAIEQRSGVKVVRSGDAKPPGALIIEVPQLLAQRLAPAPDSRLIEKSRYGLLPRIGKDGVRPADVYARPWNPDPTKPNAPRLALVIGGLGLSDSATAQAISDLPGAVTLAFAPYGNDLPGKIAQAREAGHEVILQLPMEPIDYPRTNPGPHTLLASASPAQRAEDLHWIMARFTGYTGVANFLGAKFAGAPEALRPILREISDRGLFYLDDGTTPGSAALGLAKALGFSAQRADLILDAPAEGIAASVTIEANLARLEAIAREKGIAIGMASDLPATVEKLAHYAQQVDAHGFVLIPLSAAIGHAAIDTASAHDRASARALSDR